MHARMYEYIHKADDGRDSVITSLGHLSVPSITPTISQLLELLLRPLNVFFIRQVKQFYFDVVVF